MSNPPFFVVGSQRSGTTLLRLILNSHSSLYLPYESGFLQVFKQFPGEFADLNVNPETVTEAILEEDYTKRGAFLKRSFLDEITPRPGNFAQLYSGLLQVACDKAEKKRWGIKTPGYHTHIDELVCLFKGCKIIHLVRDGRAVAESLKRTSWGSNNILKIAQEWDENIHWAHKMGSMVPNQYIEIKYEDLVSCPQDTLEKICQFLGIGFEPGMLDFHETAQEEMPKETIVWHQNSVSPPKTDKIDSWKTKLSKTDRAIFQAAAKRSLRLFDYEIEDLALGVWGKTLQIAYFFRKQQQP